MFISCRVLNPRTFHVGNVQELTFDATQPTTHHEATKTVTVQLAVLAELLLQAPSTHRHSLSDTLPVRRRTCRRITRLVS